MAKSKKPKSAKGKKPRAAHGTVNGKVLTAKRLPAASYAVIHGLPRGTREATLKALLAMAVAASKRLGAGWHEKAIAGKLKIAGV